MSKLHKEASFTIDALSHDGRGVASLDGKKALIDGALPDEQVIAKRTKRHKQFDEWVTLTVQTSSALRITPPCDKATVCGGCSLQHLGVWEQLLHKQQVVLEQLRHFGQLEPQMVLDPLSGPSEHYRRKARLGVRYVTKRDEVLIGFREKATHFITDITECPVLDSRVSVHLTALREVIRSLSVYKQVPQIEVACGDDECALVFRHLEPLTEKDRQILINFSKQSQLTVYLQSKGVDSIIKLWPEDNSQYLSYQLDEPRLTWQFKVHHFIQVNATVNRLMLERAVKLLAPTPDDCILDLFCGLGNFSLLMAAFGAKVTGVEGSSDMVQQAQHNAQLNQLDGIDFYSADLNEPIDGLPWFKRSYNKVIIDPPRSGALSVIKALAHLEVEQILYVSCNPATLARDSQQLVTLGYQLSCLCIMDMFSHTSHIETMALFLKPK